jgi:outer membrane protein assembly factor BamB
MKKKGRKWLFLTLGACVLGLGAALFWAQVVCTSYTATFTENFDTVNYKDEAACSVADWPSGPITLNKLGANFTITQPTGMGAHIYTCDGGDFDGDGKIDMIGLDIENNNRLILIRNHWEDLNGDGDDDDGVVFQIDPAYVFDQGLNCGPAAITVADFNNDGLLDFFFMKNGVDEFGYTAFVAAMYINAGSTLNPVFYVHNQTPNLDFTNLFQARGIYINWAANHVEAVDIDQDGDMDLVVISQDKIFLVRNPGPANFDLSHFSITELAYNQRTGYTGGRGGSAIACGDFNGDGFVDLATGSVNNYNYLALYENDGTGHFIRKDLIIPNASCTGTVGLCIEDYNQDGRVDIFGATDAWNAGNPAHMWIYLNKGEGTDGETAWQFRCLNDCQPILPDPHDVDVCTTGDYDGDGDMDIILADANHSGDYFLVINDIAPVYTLSGQGVSTNIADGLDPNEYAITQVQVTNISQHVIGPQVDDGLKVELYFTANGTDWERYATWTGSAIHNYSNLASYQFLHFGTRLMWKAVLSAGEDSMVEYTDASYETPAIDSLTIKYTYIERREYSRTSVAASIYFPSDEKVKLIIGGTFVFPGWQGQLRAYDITRMPAVQTSTSELRTITRSDLSSPTGREIVAEDVDIFWDAGEMLNDRSASSRVIYTAVRQSGHLNRYDFSTSNLSLLGPILQDYNNNNSGLIDFVRGEGRDWKLGDINHSTPVVLGAPSDNPILKGDGYEEFKETWKNRELSLFVGANDGMLHCFDVKTGTERWAFVPYNLLPKLRNMWAVDSVSHQRYFKRDVYVDGSPVVADVFIDADGDGDQEWRTILVCGQGPGIGSTIDGGNNYYFALDVTNVDNPMPLWEFTGSRVGETWSVPVVGRVVKNGADTWVAFMGSGPKNFTSNQTVGNYFYAVDLSTGTSFWSFNANNVNTKNQWPNGVDIANCITGSPALIDIDGNGYADRVYVGDQDGRMWRVNVSIPWVHSTSWSGTAIYTDPDNYPIITRPATWTNSLVTGLVPVVYFGTGGNDQAPSNVIYSFIALDDGASPNVEWYLGDPATLDLPTSKQVGTFVTGEKVWADPVIANYTVFFSTLTGNIESVDPCQSLAGEGKLYARFVQAFSGSVAGASALKGSGGMLDYMTLEIKSRSAVTLGESESTQSGSRKREVFIHEFDSTIQKLEQPVGSSLKVKSWREIYRIIR